jgi:uracil-DNA glycosylase
MTATVGRWRQRIDGEELPRRVALPHPSWRNNAWLSANPWFERELLPRLQQQLRKLL